MDSLMSNDLCEGLNHVMFDSSDPEKHDQLQHSFPHRERKNVLVFEKRQLVTMVTSVPQDLTGAAHKRLEDSKTI